MKAAIRQRLLLASALVAMCALPVLQLQVLHIRPSQSSEGKLTATQQELVRTITELTKLFINWSLAVLAGSGWAIRRHLDAKEVIGLLPRMSLATAVTSAVLAIYFGQMTLSSVAMMLDMSSFELNRPEFLWPSGLQYLFLTLAVLSLGIYMVETLLTTSDSPLIL